MRRHVALDLSRTISALLSRGWFALGFDAGETVEVVGIVTAKFRPSDRDYLRFNASALRFCASSGGTFHRARSESVVFGSTG